MNKKIDRELNGPSWAEVILGAALSLILGVVLSAAFLVFKPVATVKEMPKEPDPETIYFVQGTQISGRAREAAAKQRALQQPGTVVLNEDELNVLAAPVAPGAKKAAGAPADAASADTIAAAAPNFRVRDNVLQLAVPVQLNALGLQHEVVVQARGGFEKIGDTVVFAPKEFYVGSCPIQRLPGVEPWVMKRVLAAIAPPSDVATAWQRVTDASVEGSTVRVVLR